MSQTPQDPAPPAPGWWLASDGNWYPPQPAPPAPPAQPAPAAQVPVAPAPTRSNKGCLVVLGIVGVVFAVIAVVVVIVIWKVADTVENVATGVTLGDVKCPSEGKVSDVVGHDVDLAMSGNLVIASGCNYTSTEQSGGASVSITSGAGLITDEVMADLESDAQTNGATTSSIDVGDGGRAFGSDSRSEAATKAGGHVVEVEIFADGDAPIGDKRDEAVELLGLFVDLNY